MDGVSVATLGLIIPVAILVAFGFAFWLARDVLSRDTGTAEMQAVGDVIYEGAVAFMRRQYSTIMMFAVVTALILFVVIGKFDQFPEAEGVSPWMNGLYTAIAFLVGASLSALSGVIGMWVAVRSNVRVAAAAQGGVGPALTVALRGGAVSGFLVVALSLLGVWGVFEIYGRYLVGGDNWFAVAPYLIVGLGFGASFVALFAQLGGGIYTKAADVGADLVGKVEQGIPEDDPRNPAVVADLVGDNVGDCAGRGADLFESTVAENIGAMILGILLWRIGGNVGFIFFPLVVRSFGIFGSAAGVLTARMRPGETDPMKPLNRGFYITTGLNVAFLAFSTYMMFGESWAWWFGSGLIGIATALAFLYITQYYTESRYRPVQSIAEASKTGSATNIITGLAVSLETTAAPAIAISIALLATYWTGTQAAAHMGVTSATTHSAAGIYATAVATMGMLMSAAYILAMDTFGPIVDNAGGIVEMSDAPEDVRRGTDALDSAGNTTKALTKGYAIGSAALAAFLLFRAYLDKVAHMVENMGGANDKVAALVDSGTPLDQAVDVVKLAVYTVDMGDVKVFVGALIGAMLVFLFSSLAISAVGDAAKGMIEEVRRQFAADPGIMAGTSKPDYAQAVDISTRAALRQMVAPGLLAVLVPVAVGLLLKSQAAAGLLMVGTITGVMVATSMNNGGGAWDNAKKLIEAGKLMDDDGNALAKGSEAHAAAVVGDTVGDPYKDTAGPSIHVLIKLLATITLVLSPLFM
ncbi:MAG: sodium-translocating pyrophosphatase [Anaerolineae bacterium]